MALHIDTRADLANWPARGPRDVGVCARPLSDGWSRDWYAECSPDPRETRPMRPPPRPIPSTRHRRWRPRYARPLRVTSRRRFLLGGAGMVALGGAILASRARPSAWTAESDRLPIRPPSANPDDARFRASCIGCGLCGTVCENGCIRYFGADEPSWGSLTPYLDLRRRSCTLCMRCTQICPTGALTAIECEPASIAARVRMGVAVVDPDRCLSYLGRLCGYCHDACPLPQNAIKLTPPARPVVITDGCVGCGRCVELCPQTPTAIDVRRGVPT
ncbi:4Fe-4S dicluster domain-containing protein [Haliangium sp.]|uniref:4Fe-4S dicluster domain-containing protein n=1 Tax=Haliangium sp. TaxID=2663208 RepID=UPI003D0C148A